MKMPSLRSLRPVALLLLTPVWLSAQTAAAPVVVKETLLTKLNMPAIWFLLVCSMLIVWFVLDGFMNSGRKKLLPEDTITALRNLFRQGDYHGAYAYTAANPGAFSNVVRAGLKNSPGGQEAAEDAMANAIVGENSKFQNKIAYLSVIGVIAPMVGLTGTVLGMIDAFAAMGAAGAADPSKLSGAIGHVLYATAGGLAVAIPAFVFYYLLRNRTSHAIHELSVEASDLFRRFPYQHLGDVSFEGGEAYAAVPKWIGDGSRAATA